MMSRVKQGLIVGFIATVVVSIVELVNVLFLKMFLPFPEVIARFVGQAGNVPLGWALHFAIGTLILGPLFVYLYPKLPSNTPITRGILFAVACWVGLLLLLTMTGDRRLFIGSDGFGVFGFMLLCHMIFGGVMGNALARLQAREKRAATVVGAAPAH